MPKRKSPTQADESLVKRAITTAMKTDMQAVRPLIVDPKRRAQAIAHARPAPSINVRDNLLRIVEEADPLGFLISVQNGDLLPVTHIDESGELVVAYVQPTIGERIGVAQFFTHKVLPTITLKAETFRGQDEEKEPGVRPGQHQTFSEMVAEAASRARASAGALPGPENVWEAAPDDGDSYGDAEGGDKSDE